MININVKAVISSMGKQNNLIELNSVDLSSKKVVFVEFFSQSSQSGRKYSTLTEIYIAKLSPSLNSSFS